MTERLYQRSNFGAAIFYKNPLAALEWLERAFGFERSMLITNPDGSLAHAEMTVGDGYITVGSEWAAYAASPESTGGKNTQILHVHLEEGIETHCVRARAAGAAIVRELSDEFYGDRVYSARDPEGHVWTFAQTARVVSRAEAEAASGLTIDSPAWK
jgi:uncharacterized glyoxalase superfamily protein PhnB